MSPDFGIDNVVGMPFHSGFSNSTFDAQTNMIGRGVWQIQPNAHLSMRAPRESHKNMALSVMEDLKRDAMQVSEKSEKNMMERSRLLRDLGFKSLHNMASQIAERAMKENLIALTEYKKITAAKMKAASKRIQEMSEYSLMLTVTPVEKYMGQHVEMTPGGYVVDQEVSLPPMDVLEKFADAKKEGIFDSFAIIHVAKVNDPIIVGRINGSEDLYMIAEWGNDISFDELMA